MPDQPRPRGRPPSNPKPSSPAGDLEQPAATQPKTADQPEQDAKQTQSAPAPQSTPTPPAKQDQAKVIEDFYNNTMLKTPLLSIGKIIILKNYRGTNWLVSLDKLGRPAVQLQMDAADYEEFKKAVASV